MQVKYVSRYAPKNPDTTRPVMLLKLQGYGGLARQATEIVSYIEASPQQTTIANLVFDRLYMVEDFEPFTRFRVDFVYPTEYKYWILVNRRDSAHEILNAQLELDKWLKKNTKLEATRREVLVYG